MCALCETGCFCLRHDTTRERLDRDPSYEDAREIELERANAEASVVYFETPWKEAA